MLICILISDICREFRVLALQGDMTDFCYCIELVAGCAFLIVVEGGRMKQTFKNGGAHVHRLSINNAVVRDFF